MSDFKQNDPNSFRLDLPSDEYNAAGQSAVACHNYARFMAMQILELVKALNAQPQDPPLIQAMLTSMTEATCQVEPLALRIAETLLKANAVWIRKGKLQ